MPPDYSRRSSRVPKEVAITLVGSDLEGRVFSERTKTVVLSRHGAGIISSYKLSAEQEIVIRNEESRKEAEARVVGQIGSNEETYTYGIAFLDANINFWGLSFPELSESEKRASQIAVECSSCHSRVIADLSDLASDVMAVNDGIVRYCQRCLSSTLWKRAAENEEASRDSADSGSPALLEAPARSWREGAKPVRPARQAPTSGFASSPWSHAETVAPAARWEPSAARSSAAHLDVKEPLDEPLDEPLNVPAARPASKPAVSPAEKKEQENRRKHARTRVNFRACIRRKGQGDDIVTCEDMSRGGLRFKSKQQYFEKTLIEVAVPYAPGDQAIFVAGQIVYAQELPEQKLYRCGVMYLRSGR